MAKFVNARFALIAAAVSLGAPAIVQAQSSVTISGYLDTGIYKDSSKTWNVGPIQRSFLAFSGSEDLGNGLAAIFRLSTRFDTGTGALESANKPFWHDEATVGLKGAFGTVKFGRRLDAMQARDWQFDPWWNFDRVASPAWDTWHYNYPTDPRGNNGTAEYGRVNNSVFYDSPTVGGFSLYLSGSPETQAGDTKKPFAAAINYTSQYFVGMISRARNTAGNTDNFYGARVNVDALSVMAAFDDSRAGTSKAKATTVGAQYALGKTTLKGGWGQVDVDGVKAARTLGGGAFYSLSKRTTVYGELARKKFTTTTSTSATLYGVGITHTF